MPPANRSRPIWVAPVAPFALVVVSVLALNGCGGRPTEVTGGRGEERAKEDPWQKFVGGFRGEADWQKVRQLLADLNSGLAGNSTAARPQAAEPAELTRLKADLRLTDREATFLAQSDYAPLDAHYLAECLYLRDAAAGLGVQDSDPLPVRAGAAFDWVCRQVVNVPWMVKLPDGVFTQPPVPPVYVLRRGAGTGTERAFVFLALCRQLGLDACLVGTAAADRDWTYSRSSKSSTTPGGPFWAVGVKAGNDLLLYNPWRGEAFPGKTADRPATLAELKADPTLIARWKDDKTAAWDVPDADVNAAELYLSVPLTAVAPRTATVHEKLAGTVGGSYWVNWAETTTRLAAGGNKVSGWNPPADPFTPTRGLGSFLPTQQGGLDTQPEVKNVYAFYIQAQTSRPNLTLNLPDLKHEAVSKRLLDIARGILIQSYHPQLAQPDSVVWPPLEKIHRGRHHDATKELIDLRDRFTEAVKVRAGAGALAKGDDTRAWVAKANELYDNLSRAKVSENRAIEVPAIERQIEEFWKASQQKAGLLLMEIAGTPGAAEATFLLAKSFHERAERAELDVKRAAGDPAAREKAKAAWASATSWWGQYDRYRELQNQSYPGRGDLTKKLAERADKLAK